MTKIKSSLLSKLWIGILCCIFSLQAQAQSIPYPFQLPADITVPQWVKQTNWQAPNVWVIDSLIAGEQSSKKEEEGKRGLKTTSGKLVLERETDEEPYRTAYQRWRLQMTPFIQNDGSIKYDPDFYKIQMQKALAEQDLAKKKRRQNV